MTHCDALVKGHLVCGTLDNVTCEDLMREEDLNVEKAVTIRKAAEQVKERAKELQQVQAPTVHAVQANRISKNSTQKDCGDDSGNCRGKQQYNQTEGHSHSSKHNARSSAECICCCGRPHALNICLAYGETCRRFGKQNHFQKKFLIRFVDAAEGKDGSADTFLGHCDSRRSRHTEKNRCAPLW